MLNDISYCALGEPRSRHLAQDPWHNARTADNCPGHELEILTEARTVVRYLAPFRARRLALLAPRCTSDSCRARSTPYSIVRPWRWRAVPCACGGQSPRSRPGPATSSSTALPRPPGRRNGRDPHRRPEGWRRRARLHSFMSRSRAGRSGPPAHGDGPRMGGLQVQLRRRPDGRGLRPS